MLTPGHNYSTPVCSSPGLGRYLTPWRVPAFQRGRERSYSALLTIRHQKMSSSSTKGGGHAQQNDHNYFKFRKAGVFLPQVSEEMASAVAVAARS